MAEKSSVRYDTISRTSVSTQSMFNKCCFCIDLRIGCLVLGYVNLVSNIFQTLNTAAITTILGVVTHGFDHFDKPKPMSSDTEIPVTEKEEEFMLSRLGLVLIIFLVLNFAWLIINIACLVGLHKKRPGPIRIYIGFATARLMVAVGCMIYMMTTMSSVSYNIITHILDLGIAAYFIFVYYVYANQLEKEREQEILAATPITQMEANLKNYPVKIDKEHFVA